MADIVTLAVLIVLVMLAQFNFCPSHSCSFVVVYVVDLVVRVCRRCRLSFVPQGLLFHAHVYICPRCDLALVGLVPVFVAAC